MGRGISDGWVDVTTRLIGWTMSRSGTSRMPHMIRVAVPAPKRKAKNVRSLKRKKKKEEYKD